FAQDNVLEQTYIERKVAAAVTDDAIKAHYDQMVKAAPPKEEVHARHILLATEDEAKQVIADIKGGPKFEDVAKPTSQDPSAAQNGADLGFFSKEEMVPEFAEAAFKGKPGELLDAPVKTQFGWHVIEVMERRAAPPPSLEDSKAAIVSDLRNQAAQDAITSLQKGASIKKFNIDGSPIPEAPAKPDAAKPDADKPADKPANQKQQ